MPRARRTAIAAAALLGVTALVAALVISRGDAGPAHVAAVPDVDEPAPGDPVDPVAPVDAAPVDAGAAALRVLLGEVLDEKDAPIGGAVVRATLADGSIETRASDGEGTFTLDGLRADIRTLSFSAPGYAPVDVPGARLPRMAEAFWSQKLARGSERLLGVGGTVVDDRGAPVTEFRLVIAPVRGDERMRRSNTFVENVSDESGAFTRPTVDEPVTVHVIARGFRPSTPVTAAPGDHVRIVVAKSNALRGRVTDAGSGAPIAGARVSLDGMRMIEGVITGDDGRYLIETLPTEKVSVNVRADGYLPLTLGGVEGGRSRDEVLDAKLAPLTAGIATEVVGIGVSVGRHPAGVLVRDVFDGPARGVLDKGDVIIEVDGASLGGKPLREGMSAIRGEPGTSVRLVVQKSGGGEQRVTLERARVAVPEG